MSSLDSSIIGSGAKRTRRGSYKTVYLCSKGKGRRYYYRAEIQTHDMRGVTRIRKWFKYRDDAMAWINGRQH